MRTSIERDSSSAAYLEVSFPALAGMSGSPLMHAESPRVIGVLYQNFRAEILEDFLHEIRTRQGTTEETRIETAHKIMEFGKAVDLAKY